MAWVEWWLCATVMSQQYSALVSATSINNGRCAEWDLCIKVCNISEIYKVAAVKEELVVLWISLLNLNTSSRMGDQPPVLYGEESSSRGLCCPPQIGIHMVYIHAAAAMDRWNKLGFEETHLFFLTQRVCIGDLQCLAFRCLKLGVRRPILNVSSCGSWMKVENFP